MPLKITKVPPDHLGPSGLLGSLQTIRNPQYHQGPTRPSGYIWFVIDPPDHQRHFRLSRSCFWFHVTPSINCILSSMIMQPCSGRETRWFVVMKGRLPQPVMQMYFFQGDGGLIKPEDIVSNGAAVCQHSEVETLLLKHSEAKDHLVTEFHFLPSLPFLTSSVHRWLCTRRDREGGD